MTRLRLFCFKQFFKIHIFCVLMTLVFNFFMKTNFGIDLWFVLILSTVNILIFLFTRKFKITCDHYTFAAITSCISLSIITVRFLWVAFFIDLFNMIYFFTSLLIFGIIVAVVIKMKSSKSKVKKRKNVDIIKRLRYLGWSFLLFLFFYQLILSYLLRPNFLTVMALSISHLNLLLIMWTYFDILQLYKKN